MKIFSFLLGATTAGTIMASIFHDGFRNSAKEAIGTVGKAVGEQTKELFKKPVHKSDDKDESNRQVENKQEGGCDV